MRDKRHRWNLRILVLLSAVFCVGFFCLKTLQYKSFFSYEWEDDARENQVVYNIAMSLSPYQTIYNTIRNQELSAIFDEHFAPIYFLIAVFYKIFPHIYSFYFLICFSYTFSSVILYLLARKILDDEKTALYISLIYLLYPPLHYAVLGVIESRSFVLPFLFFVFYCFYTKRFIAYLFFMVLACLCKEDVPVYFFIFGIYQLMSKSPRKWWISTLLFSGLYFIAAVYLTNVFCSVPLPPDESGLPLSHYDYYINMESLQRIASSLMHDGEQFILTIFDWRKIRFFIMQLYPVIFLPIFSIEFYTPIAVLLLEIGLPDGFFNQNSDYVALMTPFIFLSLIFTFKKLRVRFGGRIVSFVVLLIIGLCLANSAGRNMIGCVAVESGVFDDPYAQEYDRRFLDVRNIFDERLYAADDDDRIAWELLQDIPENAAVTVTGDLLPAVSSRKYVYEFGLNHPKAFESEFYFEAYPSDDVDFILINRKCLINGLGGRYAWLSRQDLEDEIERLVNERHFVVKKEKGTFLLLMRENPPSAGKPMLSKLSNNEKQD